MSYIAPVMAFSTGILSLIFEPWNEFRTNVYFNSSWHVTRTCLLLLFGGTLAFFMVRIQLFFFYFWGLFCCCLPKMFIVLFFAHSPKRLFLPSVHWYRQHCLILLSLRRETGRQTHHTSDTTVCAIEFLLQSFLFLFLQVLTEYILVSVTSAVTVTIAGVVKEVVTISVWIVLVDSAFFKTSSVITVGKIYPASKNKETYPWCK